MIIIFKIINYYIYYNIYNLVYTNILLLLILIGYKKVFIKSLQHIEVIIFPNTVNLYNPYHAFSFLIVIRIVKTQYIHVTYKLHTCGR